MHVLNKIFAIIAKSYAMNIDVNLTASKVLVVQPVNISLSELRLKEVQMEDIIGIAMNLN